MDAFQPRMLSIWLSRGLDGAHSPGLSSLGGTDQSIEAGGYFHPKHDQAQPVGVPCDPGRASVPPHTQRSANCVDRRPDASGLSTSSGPSFEDGCHAASDLPEVDLPGS